MISFSSVVSTPGLVGVSCARAWLRRLLTTTVVWCAACGSEVNPDSTAVARSAALPAPAADTNTPYQAADSVPSGIGSLAVWVTVADSTVADTVVFPIRDFEVCGAQLIDNSLKREGPALTGALVWLAGVNGGKQLPVRNSFDISHERCLLSPRVQSATVRGTLIVRNMDQAVHVLRFVDVSTRDTLARITQSERGQVVPIEYLLDVPRVIEVTCESHPWTRAWIHVFDHPYHAMTGRGGMALLDSIPSGAGELLVWHERFAHARQSIAVEVGVRTEARVVLGAREGGGGG